MKFEELSEDAKESALAMIEYCVEHGIAMGMDEGFADPMTHEKHEFRKELEKFTKANSISN